MIQSFIDFVVRLMVVGAGALVLAMALSIILAITIIVIVGALLMYLLGIEIADTTEDRPVSTEQNDTH